MDLPKKIKAVFAEHGRAGGLQTSKEKRAACVRNLEKAREARWPKGRDNGTITSDLAFRTAMQRQAAKRGAK